MMKANAVRRSSLIEQQDMFCEASGAVQAITPIRDGFQLQYQHPRGSLYQGDSIDWLASLDANSVDLVFADPPYNIKKADWDTFENQEEYIQWSMKWVAEAARVLKPTGSLYVCGFSEILADLKHPSSKYFAHCRWLVWHYKNKANLGNDWGRSHESIMHLRKADAFKLNIDDVRVPYGAHTLKYPSHPQAETSAYGKGSKKSRDNWLPHPEGREAEGRFRYTYDLQRHGRKDATSYAKAGRTGAETRPRFLEARRVGD